MSKPEGEGHYDVSVLVTRGDEMPKKNYEKKKHPTYEVRLIDLSRKNGGKDFQICLKLKSISPGLIFCSFFRYIQLFLFILFTYLDINSN